VLANKTDERASWEIEDAALAELRARGWTVLETSAKMGANVEEAFLLLTAEMLKAQDESGGDDDE
jgi:hypothetical protein